MKSLLSLNRYIWKYKRLLLIGLVCVVVSNLLVIYPPQIVRIAVDLVADLIKLNALHEGYEANAAVGGMIAKSLLVFSLLTIAFALLRGVFLFFTRQTLIVMSRRVEYDLRNDMYAHYQELPLSFYRQNRTGDLMARISEDVSRVRMYLGPGIMYSINTISLSVIVVATMLVVNPELTLYTVLPLPLLSYLIYYVESRVLKRSDRIQQQMSRLTAFAQEIFSGIRVAKAYARERDFSGKFGEENMEYKSRSMSLIRLNAFFFPVVMLLVGLSTALLVWIGAEKVVEGTLSIGNIAEFIIYVNLLTWPIIAIGWVTSLVQRAAASQTRINQFMHQKSEIHFPEEGANVTNADVVFDSVSYRYEHTGILALRELSFELGAGQKLGIIGHTGSGKSTICNLLPRLLDPTSGKILIDGREINEYDRKNLRSVISYAPQDVFLFSETIRENVAFGLPGASDQEVEDACRNAGIYDAVMDFPAGFATVVGERGVTLSGGQKQRLALARAWIRKPKILILDDSLSSVDTKTEELILSNLRKATKQAKEMSLIMVSHRISTIQDSDLIIVLENGQIIERGSHSDLLELNGQYALIYRKQLIEEELSV